MLNVVLAFFNFLPIPPLDGFKVLLGSLPPDMAVRVAPIQRYGFILLIIMIFVLPAVELDILDFWSGGQRSILSIFYWGKKSLV